MMSGNKQEFVIVGLGEVLWDMLPGGKQLGGAPANFAYHVSGLGGKSYVASCVGDDDLGREVLDIVKNRGLDDTYIAVDTQYPTGTVAVKLDENGSPNYVITETVAWDYIPATDKLLELAGKCDAVCFGSLAQRASVSCNTIRSFLSATKPACLRILDVNLRRPFWENEVVRQALGLADIVKLNDEELGVVAEISSISGSESDILSGLKDKYNLKLVALTKGAGGSLLYNGSRQSSCEAAKVDVVDTVGAGDAFTAALTMGLLGEQKLDAINKFASELAGFVCSQKGATPKVPERLLSQNFNI